MTDICLVARELPRNLNTGRQMYSVHDMSGRVVLERCREPLCDAARALLDYVEVSPSDHIVLCGPDGEERIRATVAWAADHTVSESNKTGPTWIKYVPMEKGTYDD